jgi:hypothetical protein
MSHVTLHLELFILIIILYAHMPYMSHVNDSVWFDYKKKSNL